MKSITEQASSVAKAIQKGWERAGKPKEFSVKVFEEEQTNFFGFSTQPAKIGIFFEQVATAPIKISAPQRHEQRSSRPQRQSLAKTESPEINEQKSQQFNQQEQREIWTEALLEQAQKWLNQLLQELELEPVKFTLQGQNYDLIITFNKPLVLDNNRQQQLNRSLSLLLMQTLRHKMRRPLRGFRISINHA